jgi:hypothetical protein
MNTFFFLTFVLALINTGIFAFNAGKSSDRKYISFAIINGCSALILGMPF